MLERRDGVEHPLHPAGCEHGLGPGAPRITGDRAGHAVGDTAIAHDEEATDHVLKRTALTAEAHTGQPLGDRAVLSIVIRVGRRRAVRVRQCVSPFKLEVPGFAGKRLAEQHVHLVREQVERVLNGYHGIARQCADNPDDLHTDGIAVSHPHARVVSGVQGWIRHG